MLDFLILLLQETFLESSYLISANFSNLLSVVTVTPFSHK